MSVRALLQRLRADRLLAAAALLVITTTLTLLAAGPIYADAVSLAALRQKLESAPGSQNGVRVALAGPTELAPSIDDRVKRTLNTTLGSVRAVPVRTLSSQSFDFEDGSRVGTPTDKVDLMVIHHVEGMERYVEITGGRWPQDVDVGIEVTIDERVADLLEIAVGDQLSMAARGQSDDRVSASVVGRYRISDQGDPFWLAQTNIAHGTIESRTFRTVSLITNAAGVLDASGPRFDAQWTVEPDFRRLELDEVDGLRRRISRLETRIESALESQAGDAVEDFSPVIVETAVADLLADSTRSLTVTRSGVYAVVLQLSVLAGYSLFHLAGLFLSTRENDAELVRVRGGGPGQAAAQSAIEACLLVLPAMLLAPWLAVAGVGMLDAVGPLASIGLMLEPSVVTRAVLVMSAGAAVTIALLVWPSFRAARINERTTSRRRREKPRSATQRVGADLAVVCLACVLLWQLGSLGSDRTDVIRGRFGVDPLLLLVPVVTMAAGAMLALRIVPVLVRAAERFVDSSRSAEAALVGWQLARRPLRYSQASLLLILATAMAVFATTYDATWYRSQQDQARHQVGADATVQPNRRVGDSIGDLHLGAAHTTIDGVALSMAVGRSTGSLAGSDLPAVFVRLDAARAEEVVTARGDIDAALDQAFRTLEAERPTMGALPLAGRPDGIRLDVEATEEVLENADGEQLPVQFFATAFVVIQDGNDMLHRVSLGEIMANAGPSTLTAELGVTGSDGSVLGPVYPLSVVDIELRMVAPQAQAGVVNLDLLRIRPTEGGRDGPVATDLATPMWRPTLKPQGPLNAQATIADEASQPDDGRRLRLDQGRAGFVVPVFLSLRPAGPSNSAPTPVVVSEQWLTSSNSAIGDIVSLTGVPSSLERAVIAGAVPRFPTVDPSRADVVLIDLPTAQMLDYEIGRPIAEVGEYWLALDDSQSNRAPAIANRLTNPPIESVEVALRSNRAEELISDPPALGLVGVLMLGAFAAGVFAIIGVVVSFAISVRERASDFALLGSLGLAPRQLGRWILTERALLVGLAVVLGSLLGVLMSALVLPLISLTQEGETVIPAPEVTYPWSTIIVVLLSIVGLLALASGFLHALRRPSSLADVMRSGGI